jgi:hypothetical protein
MKKIILGVMLILFSITISIAQQKSTTDKVKTTADKILQKSEQVSENAQTITENSKKIVRLFRRNRNKINTNGNINNSNSEKITNSRDNTQMEIENDPTNEILEWGNQHNSNGNFLDAFHSKIKNAEQAEEDPLSIDLVFLADQFGGYMLASPVFLKNNDPGFTYENVVKGWSDINESEVALTRLTIAEFEKIKPGDAIKISALAKQISDYSSVYQSPDQKLKGKVFAIRLEMDNKKVYALVAITEHMGTYGSSGHLKIKIKTAGINRQ